MHNTGMPWVGDQLHTSVQKSLGHQGVDTVPQASQSPGMMEAYLCYQAEPKDQELYIVT